MEAPTNPADWQQTLLGHLSINHPVRFWIDVIVLSYAIRFTAFVLRAINVPVAPLPKPFWKPVFRNCFFSISHFYPLVIGALELITYPVLMRSGAWFIIGAWIGFKTVANYEDWKTRRDIFNVFLIGNALVVIASYLFLLPRIAL